MARFYQHLTPGDNMGKIVRLKYIDDISDDELILYYFSDNTKCSSEFIADVEDASPIQAKKAMITLAGPDCAWTVIKKEIPVEESEKMVGVDGVLYEAPTPGMTLGGAAGGTSRTVEKEQKEGTRIEVKPPHIPQRYKLQPLDDFKLSIHPELEGTEGPDDVNLKKSEHGNVLQSSGRNTEEINNFDEELYLKESFEELKYKKIKNPLQKKNTVWNLNIDNALTNNTKMVSVTTNGKTINIPIEEFISRISNEYESPNPQCKNDVFKNEDVLIKNMIEKSKKKTCKITMGITLELPPKEVYDTIKSVYEEGMSEQFVKSLTARIPQDSLLSSLASGLSGYYDKKLYQEKQSEEQH
jgi:hypothetical protein